VSYEMYRQLIFQVILPLETLWYESLGAKSVERLKTWRSATSRATNTYGSSTNDDYLEKLSSGTAITLWCDGVPGRKQVVYEHSDSDSDDETQRNSTSRAKRMRKSLSEVKNACVQEIFEKLKARHVYKYTGPQYCLWSGTIDVNRHSSYYEHPQGFFVCNAGTYS